MRCSFKKKLPCVPLNSWRRDTQCNYGVASAQRTRKYVENNTKNVQTSARLNEHVSPLSVNKMRRQLKNMGQNITTPDNTTNDMKSSTGARDIKSNKNNHNNTQQQKHQETRWLWSRKHNQKGETSTKAEKKWWVVSLKSISPTKPRVRR